MSKEVLESFHTPILFVVFNRPDTTKLVFEEIRRARPSRLFITADGPRKNRPEDEERCRLTKKVVAAVDWPCEVKTLFREENLGCKYAVSDAIDWFFKQVDEGIILEDDDMPDPSFFTFCQELLEKYRDDPRVMHISGDNFKRNNGDFACNESYYFSTVPHVWGWATWKRAWDLYDVEVARWPIVRDQKLMCSIFTDKAVAFRWSKLFQQYYDKKVDSYDGQWAFACMAHRGLCINPCTNLVSNIGFGSEATHAKDSTNWLANMPRQAVPIPLIHPPSAEINQKADDYTWKYVFYINRTFSQRFQWWLKSRLTGPYLFTKKIYFERILKKPFNANERLFMC